MIPFIPDLALIRPPFVIRPLHYFGLILRILYTFGGMGFRKFLLIKRILFLPRVVWLSYGSGLRGPFDHREWSQCHALCARRGHSCPHSLGRAPRQLSPRRGDDGNRHFRCERGSWDECLETRLRVQDCSPTADNVTQIGQPIACMGRVPSTFVRVMERLTCKKPRGMV